MEQQSKPELQSGFIVREREPVNLEYPFDHLAEDPDARGRLTPNELFYVRSHFKAPMLDASDYFLKVQGSVQNPFTMTLDQLKQLPSESRIATLECAGNGRVFLSPAEEGAQWQLGAVGTAAWTGVPLVTLLDRAKLAPSAIELVFEGAGAGKPKEKPVPPGEISYARSLPIAKAQNILLAYKMNGEDIPRDHGYPVRAIVSGCYGMASVKWLTAIRAVDKPFQGYWQTSDYGYWDYEDGLPSRRPLLEMKVKSSIARPRVREIVPAGRSYTVFGAAWTGENEIVKVEVSTDDGKTWSQAEIVDPPVFGVWCRWKYDWHVPGQEMSVTLKSRATDSGGKTQPSEHDKSYGSYVIHHTVGIEVITKQSPQPNSSRSAEH
jgi:DMSO/TMAO reductase YedYZ molybdopterin-dependent catalytic subunit